MRQKLLNSSDLHIYMTSDLVDSQYCKLLGSCALIKGSLDWQIDQYIGQNVSCQSVNTGPASYQFHNRYLVDAAPNIVGSTPALRWWFTDTLQGISDNTLINISNNISVGWHCFNGLPYWLFSLGASFGIILVDMSVITWSIVLIEW